MNNGELKTAAWKYLAVLNCILLALSSWALLQVFEGALVGRENSVRLHTLEAAVHLVTSDQKVHVSDPTIHHARLATLEAKLDLLLERLDLGQ